MVDFLVGIHERRCFRLVFYWGVYPVITNEQQKWWRKQYFRWWPVELFVFLQPHEPAVPLIIAVRAGDVVLVVHSWSIAAFDAPTEGASFFTSKYVTLRARYRWLCTVYPGCDGNVRWQVVLSVIISINTTTTSTTTLTCLRRKMPMPVPATPAAKHNGCNPKMEML